MVVAAVNVNDTDVAPELGVTDRGKGDLFATRRHDLARYDDAVAQLAQLAHLIRDEKTRRSTRHIDAEQAQTVALVSITRCGSKKVIEVVDQAAIARPTDRRRVVGARPTPFDFANAHVAAHEIDDRNARRSVGTA